jgi:hypothetical protein
MVLALAILLSGLVYGQPRDGEQWRLPQWEPLSWPASTASAMTIALAGHWLVTTIINWR